MFSVLGYLKYAGTGFGLSASLCYNSYDELWMNTGNCSVTGLLGLPCTAHFYPLHTTFLTFRPSSVKAHLTGQISMLICRGPICEVLP